MVKKMKGKLTKELLYEMYHNKKMSIRKIAKEVGATKGQIEHLMETLDVPRRTVAEAKKVTDEVVQEEKVVEAIEKVTELAKRCTVKTKFMPTIRKNILVPFTLNDKNKDATLTLVISDLHLGDGSHLPESYWSTVDNVKVMIEEIKKMYDVKEINLVLNGDIVTGRDVYRYQYLRNIVQRGHWQVFLAEIILKETLDRLGVKLNTAYLVKGTHDGYDFNETLMLKRAIPCVIAKYLSNGGVVNIAGKLGEYNVLFTHGFGYNASNPVPTRLLNDVSNIISDFKNRGIQVDRACSGHTHWLSSGLIIGNLYWDCCGGFQKWELSLSQRPCGMIIYLYNDGECVSIPVRPNSDVEDKEKFSTGLEYNNMKYYSKYLLEHLEKIEEVC